MKERCEERLCLLTQKPVQSELPGISKTLLHQKPADKNRTSVHLSALPAIMIYISHKDRLCGKNGNHANHKDTTLS